MNAEPQRTCASCGNEFSGAMEFCPVCMLRFEYYELVTGEDGKPIELGRGAMWITYKAFDVDLRRRFGRRPQEGPCPPRYKADQRYG
jgi:hypothetical protein